ncbi:hypothetical protein C8R43DRAFT_323214 [Mycena crocata]|nr:hypothetical protein C8R43DRAFT_323214 [Mycena crocata]
MGLQSYQLLGWVSFLLLGFSLARFPSGLSLHLNARIVFPFSSPFSCWISCTVPYHATNCIHPDCFIYPVECSIYIRPSASYRSSLYLSYLHLYLISFISCVDHRCLLCTIELLQMYRHRFPLYRLDLFYMRLGLSL